MVTAIAAVLTAILAGMFGAFVSEMYKRHRDAIATAAAIAGELSSYQEAYRELDVSMSVLIKKVQSGTPLNIPQQDPVPDVAYEAYVDKVGLLGSRLAEEVTYVYGQVRGFRSTFYGLTRQQQPLEPAYTEATLRVCHQFMKKANLRGQPLIEDLRKLATEPFWSVLTRTWRDFRVAVSKVDPVD